MQRFWKYGEPLDTEHALAVFKVFWPSRKPPGSEHHLLKFIAQRSGVNRLEHEVNRLRGLAVTANVDEGCTFHRVKPEERTNVDCEKADG